jgi:hypothetical protein
MVTKEEIRTAVEIIKRTTKAPGFAQLSAPAQTAMLTYLLQKYLGGVSVDAQDGALEP